MIRKFFATAALLALATIGSVHAAPVLCSSGPDLDLTQGCLFSGRNGNNNTEEKVEAAIEDALGAFLDLTLYGKSDDNPKLFTITGGKQGTWAVNDLTPIAFITIKAGPSQVLIFDVQGLASGTWSTAGMTNPGGKRPDMSHISFWTVPTPPPQVPEPATMALLGLGLLGLAAARRRSQH